LLKIHNICVIVSAPGPKIYVSYCNHLQVSEWMLFIPSIAHLNGTWLSSMSNCISLFYLLTNHSTNGKHFPEMLLQWSSSFHIIFLSIGNLRWLLDQLCFLIDWNLKNICNENIYYLVGMTKGFYIRNTRWPPWQDKFDIAPYGNFVLLLLILHVLQLNGLK
jgi:hypothetical protein